MLRDWYFGVMFAFGFRRVRHPYTSKKVWSWRPDKATNQDLGAYGSLVILLAIAAALAFYFGER